MSRLLCGYSKKKHEKIQDYIQNQLKEDQIAEQLELEIEDPFMGNKCTPQTTLAL